jgi:hypothetical protein
MKEYWQEIVLPMRKIRPYILIAAVFAFLVLAFVVAVYYSLKVPMSDLTRDPVQLLNGRPYIGMLSNIGIILWSGTAGVLLFSAVTLKGKRDRLFLLLAFAFTLVLLLDDLFLMHDMVFPQDLHISEYFLYGFYALLALLLVIFYTRYILQKTPFILLFIAFFLFAFSISVDTIVKYTDIKHGFFMEDGSKFIGIVCWMVYFTSIAYRKVTGDE